MALKSCSHCGGYISEYAKKCPHCNADLTLIKQPDQSPIAEETVQGFNSSANSTSNEIMETEVDNKEPNVSVNTVSKNSNSWRWIVIIILLLLVLGGGGFGYWYYRTIYIPAKIDREAPRTYPVVNVQLRSSKMAGSDFNKLITVPYGGELITYSNDGEWAKVKYIEPGTNNKIEGYVASSYLVDKRDFYILNSIFGDNDAREVLATAKVRKALLDYYKSNEYFGSLVSELQNEVGLTAKSTNQWQIIFHHGQAKPNEVLFSRLVNKNSKFTDMAVLMENINTHDRKLLYFYFDDDETPHLLFDGDAPREGNIIDIKDAGMSLGMDYNVSYTGEDIIYHNKEN